jgi:small-conductance mechanosensitive channel
MLSTTLFHIGPFNICFWNIVFLAIIFLVAAIMRRIVQNSIRIYMQSANIDLGGRRMVWLRLFSQSVYLVAIYVAILSLKFNNKDITIADFLSFKVIELPNFSLDFRDILVIISVFFGAKIVVNLTKIFISRKFNNSRNRDVAKEYVYVQVAKYIIYVFSILLCFQILEIDLTLFLTGSAALLVGVGLGLQDVFKDMFAGVVMLVENNVRVGDIVEIGGNTITSGMSNESMVVKILKINVRTTQIQTREGNVLIIPNNQLTSSPVENWSHGSELTRFSIKVTVEYNSDIELIKKLLIQAATTHPKVKKEQPITVLLNNFGENGLELELYFWADQSWEILFYKSEIRFEIDRLFRQHKITIPYPKRSVHVESANINSPSNPSSI